MDHKILNTERGIVHYWISPLKNHPTMVLLHGATMDHRMFLPQLSYFRKEFQTIAIDLPGHGLSRPYAPLSIQNMAQDVLAVLDAEVVESTHLIGQSMGGFVAQELTTSAADRINSIALIGSTPISARYFSINDRRLLSLTPSILRLYPYRMLINEIVHGISTNRESAQYAYETLRTYSKEEIITIMKAVNNCIREDDIATPCPLLITHGAVDYTGKVRQYCKQWAKKTGAPLRIIPVASHNANLDNPLATNQILEQFFYSLPGFTAALPGK